MKLSSHNASLLLVSLLSLTVSACQTTPPTSENSSTSPSAAPSTEPVSSSSPFPTVSASVPAEVKPALLLEIRGDSSLNDFVVQQARGLCLQQLSSVQTILTLPGVPSQASLDALAASGAVIQGQTLTISGSVKNLGALISGLSFRLPALPPGVITAETRLLDASGASLGSISYSFELAASGGTVSLLFKPVPGAPPSPGCPLLTAELKGARSSGFSGGVMNPGGPASPSPSQSSVSAPPALPVPRNLQVVTRTSESLTLTWDFAELTEPHSYKALLNGQLVAEGLTNNNFTFLNLNADTAYHLELQTVSAKGASAPVGLSASTTSSGSQGSGNFSGGGSSGGSRSGGSSPSPSPSPSPTLIPGGEFLVNSTTLNAQTSSVARAPNGNFIVVWQGGSDGDGSGIFAQRFDTEGDPLGTEFRVNAYTVGAQSRPDVAFDADGDFVVTWSSFDNSSIYDIYARRYRSSGTPRGEDFRVNNYTAGQQISSAVALDSEGNFVISWVGEGLNESNYGVYAKHFERTGQPNSSEFHINSYTTNRQMNVDVATDADGNFLIVWEGLEILNTNIYAQRIDNSGELVDSNFILASFSSVGVSNPAIAMDETGNFAVSWTATTQGSLNIMARHFDAEAEPISSEFVVNSYTTGTQESSAICLDEAGNFVVAWTDGFKSSGQDGSFRGIFARRFGPDGTALTSEFRVNDFTTGGQIEPAVAVDEDGDFVVTWSSRQGGSSYEVIAQTYRTHDP
ncbi:MAG: hypothetical protein ACAI44_16835 [Candidatus Sericytochromatia bacterium]